MGTNFLISISVPQKVCSPFIVSDFVYIRDLWQVFDNYGFCFIDLETPFYQYFCFWKCIKFVVLLLDGIVYPFNKLSLLSTLKNLFSPFLILFENYIVLNHIKKMYSNLQISFHYRFFLQKPSVIYFFLAFFFVTEKCW